MLKEFEFEFKKKHSETKRLAQSKKLLSKNDGKVPVIIEKYKNDSTSHNLPTLSQSKFLFPGDFTYLDFLQIIRCKLSLSEKDSIFCFFKNGRLCQGTKTLKDIYNEDKDSDGFLYCSYTFENTQG
ncbi:unnamed protein product [Moneuplotes crassus]|uniref:Autophagy-related protein n=1 Tax=Euplotes crassus TaxID=5936 RepID=A0AAD1XYW9_EUPCR|nr:unnamed protein product [Moneuplotes crassus]